MSISLKKIDKKKLTLQGSNDLLRASSNDDALLDSNNRKISEVKWNYDGRGPDTGK